MRLLLRFELPGWYFGTTRLIMRLVVQLIIRLVVNHELQADNPADNQAVSFVVIQPSTQLVVSSSRPSSRCCWQHLKEGRGDTSRRDASCAQHSSVAAASAGDGSVPRP